MVAVFVPVVYFSFVVYMVVGLVVACGLLLVSCLFVDLGLFSLFGVAWVALLLIYFWLFIWRLIVCYCC